MRYLLISDLHSNLEALQAVIEAANGKYERIVCCGDLVGYGADPNPVVDWVRANVSVVVRGNHDKACVGIDSAEDFNDAARASAAWTQAQLTLENRDYLIQLPKGPCDVDQEFAILHGSPRDEDQYIHDLYTADQVFDRLPDVLTFFGHTHLQGGFYRRVALVEKPLPQEESWENNIQKFTVAKIVSQKVELKAGETYFINPGSVGQPRDRDPRAACAIYDTEGYVEFYRTKYDVESAMRKIMDAGLPEILARRLMIGR